MLNEMLMMSLLVALVTGLWLAWVYKYKTLYTKFCHYITCLLPTIIATSWLMVIWVPGVAVAGTFSLSKFPLLQGAPRRCWLSSLATANSLAVVWACFLALPWF